ncbi:MAG TPA: hypothetical protein VHR45_00805 [Thermoanaerobaculia bacterium]|nr:hypothetical protein [Thermoanaerobaculia bacterium]
MRRRLSLLLDWLALALVALLVLTTAPTAVRRSAIRLSYALRVAGEDSLTMRARRFGASYIGAVEAIRRTLGPDEPYCLVEGGNPQSGAAFWVRYELAPRPAIYAGTLAEPAGRERLLQLLRADQAAPWHVVVAPGPGAPPALFERASFLHELEQLQPSARPRAQSSGPGGRSIDVR